MTKRIEIKPYRIEWRTDFQHIARALKPLLPERASIHHIGSTAVPGLAAKDIVDIQITVEDLNFVQTTLFAASGFRHIPNRIDHTPEGRSLALEDLTKLLFKFDHPASHVHVRERGRFNQRYALLCRDYLRAHPHALAAYEKVKFELAHRFPDDSKSYYAVKDPVFDILMAGATDWAATIEWKEPEADYDDEQGSGSV
jgi:GrpB-like predicted nucleotidyltransferase (UPF0157 family)